MLIERVSSMDDPRLAPYRDLRRNSLAERQGLFVAEGRWLAVRLLESRLRVHSVLVEERRMDDVVPYMPEDVPLYVIPNKAAPAVVGFNFHRGVLACGVRPENLRLTELSLSARSTLVLACRLQDPENVGLILRNCAAFGVEGVVFGPHCVDPYSRRVLRVSMGNAFQLPIIQVDSLVATMRELEQLQFDIAATVLDETAEQLPAFRRQPRQALIFGEEANGISPEVIVGATRTVTAPMAGNTDSLNVAVAAGIFLYHVQFAAE